MREMLARLYAWLFARDGFAQKVNHAVYHLALRGMGYNNGWQPERSGELWFVRNVLSKHQPRTCIDIGANIGIYSKMLLDETHADVTAFEPLPDAYRSLCTLEPLYEAGRFSAYDYALADVTGPAELRYGNPKSEHASLSVLVNRIPYVGNGNVNTVVVNTTTLDDVMTTPNGRWLLDDVDFIKIDVEGLEFQVLRGAEDTIRHFAPGFIQIEWNLHQLMQGNTLLQFCDILPDYTPFQLLPRGMRRVDPRRPEANTFCYANFVFVRNDLVDTIHG